MKIDLLEGLKDRTCLETTPSLFLSMFLKSFSSVVSSPDFENLQSEFFFLIIPMNSSKLSLPSKSRSILLKNSSTSSLDVTTIFSFLSLSLSLSDKYLYCVKDYRFDEVGISC